MAKSPIESALHRALLRVCEDAGLHVSDFVATDVRMQVDSYARGAAMSARSPSGVSSPGQWDYEEQATDGEPKGYVCIASDVHVHGYRVDLAVSLSLEEAVDCNTPTPCDPIVLVECDGHDWHERTPQQASRDRARDREILLKSGLPVVRFTGSEIVRDPDGCAKEVIDLAIDRWRRAVVSSECVAAYAINHDSHVAAAATGEG